MSIVDRPSPNHGPRPDGRAVDTLVLHYTGMTSAAAALDRLCDPAAQVSAHYLIDEDGTAYRLVDEARRAWHAGVSCWQGATDINDRSIGIELANPGHEWGYRPFPEPQMQALIGLCHAILARHPIPPRRVLAHSDVAPERKEDPGELFDWRRLAAAGIGIWPAGTPTAATPTAAAVQAHLARIGYCVPGHGEADAATVAAVRALQRRFRPARCDGVIDAETAAIAAALA